MQRGCLRPAWILEDAVTANKDFKRLVRARMEKTGESYAAARAQLVAAPPPDVDEYPDLAGMRDDAVQERTGLTWAGWVDALDPLGARDLDHTAIAALVRERWPDIGAWWAQTVTVGYERIRGLRQKGQLCTGDFAASKSRTYPVPVDVLYAAFVDDDVREGWIGVGTAVRTATPSRSMRLTWPDGTIVAFWFTDKGAKASVSVQHDKLDSAERRDLEKQAWGERLTALAAVCAG